MERRRVNCFIRVRPCLPDELDDKICVKSGADRKSVQVLKDPALTFDRVFLPETPLQELCSEALVPSVRDCLTGLHTTMMFYGQTGSGKTHTLMQVLPTFVRTLFAVIDRESDDFETEVSVDAVQIYMEQISDLIDPSKMNMQVREFSDTGVFVKGASEIPIGSPEEFEKLWARASRHRVLAATKLNDVSTRSHCIVGFNVSRRRKVKREQFSVSSLDNISTINNTSIPHATTATGAGGNRRHPIPMRTRGRFSFVDLAGSERLKKSQSEGLRQEEARVINQSLSSLGNVMRALRTPNATHIPYRDSKLTRLLQEPLGGGGIASIMICIPPVTRHAAETRCSLAFGTGAMEIVNTITTFKDVDGKSRMIQAQEWLENRVHYLEEALQQEQVFRTRVEAGTDNPSILAECDGCDRLRRDNGMLRAALEESAARLEGEKAGHEVAMQKAEARYESLLNDCSYYRKKAEERGRVPKEVTDEAEKKLAALQEYYQGYIKAEQEQVVAVQQERDAACDEVVDLTRQIQELRDQLEVAALSSKSSRTEEPIGVDASTSCGASASDFRSQGCQTRKVQFSDEDRTAALLAERQDAIVSEWAVHLSELNDAVMAIRSESAESVSTSAAHVRSLSEAGELLKRRVAALENQLTVVQDDHATQSVAFAETAESKRRLESEVESVTAKALFDSEAANVALLEMSARHRLQDHEVSLRSSLTAAFYAFHRDGLENDVRGSRAEASHLSSLVRGERDRVAQLNAVAEDHEQELHRTKAALTTANTRIRAIEDMTVATQGHADDLQTEVDRLTQRLTDEARQHHSQLNQLREDHAAELDLVQRRASEREESVTLRITAAADEEMRTESQALKQEVTNLTRRAIEAEAVVERLNEETQRLRESANERIAALAEEHQREVRRLNSEVKRVNQSREGDAAELRSECDQLREQLHDALRQGHDRVAEVLAKTGAETAAQTTRVEAMVAAHAAERGELEERIAATREEMHTTRTRLQKEGAELRHEISRMEEIAAQREADFGELRSTHDEGIRDAAKNTKEARRLLKHAEERAESLETANIEAQKQIEQLESRLIAEADKRRSDDTAEAESVKARLLAAEARSTQAEMRVAALEDDLKISEVALAEAKARLVDAATSQKAAVASAEEAAKQKLATRTEQLQRDLFASTASKATVETQLAASEEEKVKALLSVSEANARCQHLQRRVVELEENEYAALQAPRLGASPLPHEPVVTVNLEEVVAELREEVSSVQAELDSERGTAHRLHEELAALSAAHATELQAIRSRATLQERTHAFAELQHVSDVESLVRRTLVLQDHLGRAALARELESLCAQDLLVKQAAAQRSEFDEILSARKQTEASLRGKLSDLRAHGGTAPAVLRVDPQYSSATATGVMETDVALLNSRLAIATRELQRTSEELEGYRRQHYLEVSPRVGGIPAGVNDSRLSIDDSEAMQPPVLQPRASKVDRSFAAEGAIRRASAAEKNVQSLEQELQLSELRVQKAESALVAAETACKSMQVKLNEATRRVSQLSTEQQSPAGSAESELRQRETELQALQQKYDAVSTDLADAIAAKHVAEGRVSSLQERLRRAEASAAETIRSIEESHQEELEALQRHVSVVRSRSPSPGATRIAMTVAAEATSPVPEGYTVVSTDDAEAASKRIHELSSKCAAQAFKIQQLQAEIESSASASGAIGSVESKMSAGTPSEGRWMNEVAEKVRATADANMQRVDAARKFYEDEANRLQQQLVEAEDQSTANHHKAQSELLQQRLTNQRLHIDIQALEEERDTLSATVEESSSRIAALSKQLKRSQRQCAVLQKDREAADEQLVKLRALRVELDGDLKRSREAVAEATSKLDGAKRQADEVIAQHRDRSQTDLAHAEGLVRCALVESSSSTTVALWQLFAATMPLPRPGTIDVGCDACELVATVSVPSSSLPSSLNTSSAVGVANRDDSTADQQMSSAARYARATQDEMQPSFFSPDSANVVRELMTSPQQDGKSMPSSADASPRSMSSALDTTAAHMVSCEVSRIRQASAKAFDVMKRTAEQRSTLLEDRLATSLVGMVTVVTEHQRVIAEVFATSAVSVHMAPTLKHDAAHGRPVLGDAPSNALMHPSHPNTRHPRRPSSSVEVASRRHRHRDHAHEASSLLSSPSSQTSRSMYSDDAPLRAKRYDLPCGVASANTRSRRSSSVPLSSSSESSLEETSAPTNGALLAASHAISNANFILGRSPRLDDRRDGGELLLTKRDPKSPFYSDFGLRMWEQCLRGRVSDEVRHVQDMSHVYENRLHDVAKLEEARARPHHAW